MTVQQKKKRIDIILKGSDAEKFENLRKKLSAEFGFQLNNIATHHPVRVAFGEYGNIKQDLQRAGGWQNVLRYLFLAPGWSHDGEDKRSNTLRRLAG